MLLEAYKSNKNSKRQKSTYFLAVPSLANEKSKSRVPKSRILIVFPSPYLSNAFLILLYQKDLEIAFQILLIYFRFLAMR